MLIRAADGGEGGQAETCFVIKRTETLEVPPFIAVQGLSTSKRRSELRWTAWSTRIALCDWLVTENK